MRPDEHFREVLFPHLSFSTFLKWKYAVEVAAGVYILQISADGISGKKLAEIKKLGTN